MNTELKIIDDKVIVKDENSFEEKRDIVDNIEEILITENNIEEISQLIDKEKIVQKKSKEKKQNKYIYIILGGTYISTSLLNFFTNNITSGILHFICSLTWIANGYFFTIKPQNKIIKISEKKIDTLQNQMDEEQKKLIKLKSNSKDISQNNFFYINSEPKTISTSEKIHNLKNLLTIIEDYERNKKIFRKCYKEGTLDEELSFYAVGYGNGHIKVIEELIKKDLDNKNTNNKQKVLTKNY